MVEYEDDEESEAATARNREIVNSSSGKTF